MTLEQFIEQVRERAERAKSDETRIVEKFDKIQGLYEFEFPDYDSRGEDRLKLLRVIEKLKQQRDEYAENFFIDGGCSGYDSTNDDREIEWVLG